MTLKQSESLAQTAEYMGYCLEPDVRITRRTYGKDDLVALFHPDGAPKLPDDKRYPSASLILELGLSVAASDGVISDDEVRSLGHFLDGRFFLDQSEVRRLKQLEQVLMLRHPSLSGISKRLLVLVYP